MITQECQRLFRRVLAIIFNWHVRTCLIGQQPIREILNRRQPRPDIENALQLYPRLNFR